MKAVLSVAISLFVVFLMMIILYSSPILREIAGKIGCLFQVKFGLIGRAGDLLKINTGRANINFQNIDQNNNLILSTEMSLIIEDAENTFKHIHRILNTNIDGKRTIPFALDKIKGVGRRFGFLICKILRLNPRLRAGELTEAQCDAIANLIGDPEGHGVPRWFLNRQRDYKEGKNLQVASNVLETKLREDVERLFKIRSNRGLRHKWGLKVRGQHTKTTGRRGKTVGVERKKK